MQKHHITDIYIYRNIKIKYHRSCERQDRQPTVDISDSEEASLAE